MLKNIGREKYALVDWVQSADLYEMLEHCTRFGFMCVKDSKIQLRNYAGYFEWLDNAYNEVAKLRRDMPVYGS